MIYIIVGNGESIFSDDFEQTMWCEALFEVAFYK